VVPTLIHPTPALTPRQTGFHRALLAGAVFAEVAALLSLRTANAHEEPMEAGHPTPAPDGGDGPATHPPT
jgi:hypothetical protein